MIRFYKGSWPASQVPLLPIDAFLSLVSSLRYLFVKLRSLCLLLTFIVCLYLLQQQQIECEFKLDRGSIRSSTRYGFNTPYTKYWLITPTFRFLVSFCAYCQLTRYSPFDNICLPSFQILNYKRLCLCVSHVLSCPFIISDLNTPSQGSDTDINI